MKKLVILSLLLCLLGCSQQQTSEVTTSESTLSTTTSAVTITTTPVTMTTESTTTTTVPPTTSMPETTTLKPVSTTKKTTVTTTIPKVTTTAETTTEVTTTADIEAPVITPYLYKNGVLTKSSWMFTHEAYTVYQSSEACKWYKDGVQVTDNYVSSYVVKEGKKEISIYCKDMSGNVSKTLTQKLKITQTPKLEYATKTIDGKQTLIVYANEPVYFIVNGRQYSSLNTSITLTATTAYDIGAVDEEGHESAHFSAYIKNDDIEIVTTTDCGCTYIP